MSKEKKSIAKNCDNCKHLEFVCVDSSDSGFTCNKRQFSMWEVGREQELLDNLRRDEYRARGKRCFEARTWSKGDE